MPEGIANATDFEVEVTPEMVEAGLQEYAMRWLGLRDTEEAVEREMVIAVYGAMQRCRLSRHHVGQEAL